MCEYIYPAGHLKANEKCGARGKAAYCANHKKYAPVEVVKPVVEIVEEIVSDNSTVDSSEEEEEVDVEEVAEPVEEVEDVEFDNLKEEIIFDVKCPFSFKEWVGVWSWAGKDIVHEYSNKPDRQLIRDGYSYVLQIEAYDDETLLSGRFFYFKSEDDRKKFNELELNYTEYCISHKLYDHRLYKLCCMIKQSWFCDTKNLWNLGGMLYNKQHVDICLMRKTYLCILQTMTGEHFDQVAALKEFNRWENSKYHPTLNEAKLKAIAGGTDPKSYKEWKDEYEPKELKEKKTKKDKNTQDDDEPKYPTFNIHYEQGELPPMFDCKSDETYLDVINLKKDVITMERLYKFIKGNIAYILQGGKGYYLTKNRDDSGGIDYQVIDKVAQFDMIFNINNAIELDSNGCIEVDNTENDFDNIITLSLMKAVSHYRDDITFGKIDFKPYNAKTGACDIHNNIFDWNSNDVFNKFNGFVHKFDPNFVVDKSQFKNFSYHIKNIWSNGRDDLNDYTMKIFAWYVQKPYQKTTACLVIEGDEGCGKNIVSGVLAYHVIGKQYCLETPKIKVLTGKFNGAREQKILTVLNEAASVSKSSHDDQEELKDVITEDTFMLERKGMDPIRVKDCNNVIILSNNSFSVKASTKLRRFAFYNLGDDRIGDDAYFKSILNEFNNGDGGIHLYHYLMSIDLTGFHPQNDAPMTQTKQELQKMAIDRPIKWLVDCINNETRNNIFDTFDYSTTAKDKFVSVNDMLADFTRWCEYESRDGSSFTKDRFSKSLTKCLGPNKQKSVNGVRDRGYDLSVKELKEKIEKHTKRNDLFE
jgi:hypothetical protein